MAKRKKTLELLEPYLIETFDLQRLRNVTPLLLDWLDATESISLEE